MVMSPGRPALRAQAAILLSHASDTPLHATAVSGLPPPALLLLLAAADATLSGRGGALGPGMAGLGPGMGTSPVSNRPSEATPCVDKMWRENSGKSGA